MSTQLVSMMTSENRLYIPFKCRSPHLRLIDDSVLAFLQIIYFPRSRRNTTS